MNILEKIDTIYASARTEYDIPADNTLFSTYIPIEEVGYKSLCKFVIKKQEKAKLLLIVGKQRVYLSDIQIINTILKMSKIQKDWFLQELIILYSGKITEIQYKIEEEVFVGYGIQHYPKEVLINLFSDSTIDINDFIFLINFIFSKDMCWEIMNEQKDFHKRTLCKYIALIDFYSNSSKRSRDFLKAIDYPVEAIHPIDNKYTKILFNRTEEFDISLYI